MRSNDGGSVGQTENNMIEKKHEGSSKSGGLQVLFAEAAYSRMADIWKQRKNGLSLSQRLGSPKRLPSSRSIVAIAFFIMGEVGMLLIRD
jgi:hypothetical protein